MVKKIRQFLVFVALIVLSSCVYYEHTYREGNNRVTSRGLRWPAASTSYQTISRTRAIDTVGNYLAYKSRGLRSQSCFHYRVFVSKTIFYNHEHKKIQKVVQRLGKIKTVEYPGNFGRKSFRTLAKKLSTSGDELKTKTDSTKTN